MSDNIKTVCRNYTVITRSEFLDDDTYSLKLVEYYKRSVYSSPEDESSKERIKKFDFIIRKYIEDYSFSKKMQSSLGIDEIVQNESFDFVLTKLSQFLEEYDNNKKEIVTNTRWI